MYNSLSQLCTWLDPYLSPYHPQITAMPRHIQACDNGATWHKRGKGQDHVITGLKKNHQDISDTL